MRPVVDVIRRPHGWEMVCTCGTIHTRETWADADQLGRNHHAQHQRDKNEADRLETAALLTRQQIRAVG